MKINDHTNWMNTVTKAAEIALLISEGSVCSVWPLISQLPLYYLALCLKHLEAPVLNLTIEYIKHQRAGNVWFLAVFLVCAAFSHQWAIALRHGEFLSQGHTHTSSDCCMCLSLSWSSSEESWCPSAVFFLLWLAPQINPGFWPSLNGYLHFFAAFLWQYLSEAGPGPWKGEVWKLAGPRHWVTDVCWCGKPELELDVPLQQSTRKGEESIHYGTDFFLLTLS